MSKDYKAVLTKEPVSVISETTNHRLLKIIEAMLWGVKVEIGGYPTLLCESLKGGLVPVFVVNEVECLVQGVPDMTLAWLSDNVAQMSEEEFERISFDLSASKTLVKFTKGAA